MRPAWDDKFQLPAPTDEVWMTRVVILFMCGSIAMIISMLSKERLPALVSLIEYGLFLALLVGFEIRQAVLRSRRRRFIAQAVQVPAVITAKDSEFSYFTRKSRFTLTVRYQAQGQSRVSTIEVDEKQYFRSSCGQTICAFTDPVNPSICLLYP